MEVLSYSSPDESLFLCPAFGGVMLFTSFFMAFGEGIARSLMEINVKLYLKLDGLF